VRPTRFLLVLLIGVLVVVAALIVFDSSPHDLGCSGFSQSEWRKNYGDDSGAKALAKCGVLQGKSEPQVEAILGKTQERHRTPSGTELSWGTATDYLGDTTAWLTVQLGREGRVNRVTYDQR
jgi:hypothetical protein